MEWSTDYKSNKNIGAEQELIKSNNEFPPVKMQRAIQPNGTNGNCDNRIVAKCGLFARDSLSKLDQLRSLLVNSAKNPRQLRDALEYLVEKISIVKGRFMESIAAFQTELYQFSCDLVIKSEQRNSKCAKQTKDSDGLKLSKSPFLICVSAQNVLKENPAMFDYISMAIAIYNIQSDLQLLINEITQNQKTIKEESSNPIERLGICPVQNREVAVQTDEDFNDLNKKEIDKCDKAVSILNIGDDIVKQKLGRSLTCYVNYIPPVEVINSTKFPKENGEIIGYLRSEEYPKKTDSSSNFFAKCTPGETMEHNLSMPHQMLGENPNEQLYPASKESKKTYDVTHKRKEIKRKIRSNAVRLINEYFKVRTKESSKTPLESQPSCTAKIACKTSKCNCLQAVYEVLKGCQSRNGSTVEIEATSKSSNLYHVMKNSHKSIQEMQNVHRKHHKSKRGKNSLERYKFVSTTDTHPGRCDGVMQIEKYLQKTYGSTTTFSSGGLPAALKKRSKIQDDIYWARDKK